MTPQRGNHSFDHGLRDAVAQVSIQVKLQRSAKGKPITTSGTQFGLAKGMYMVEVQRTRSGTSQGKQGEKNKTRPYRYGEFDIIAVSLQPSNGEWHSFRYTVGNWLLAGTGPNEIATYQPAATNPNDDWTDDFDTAAKWFRSGTNKKINNTAHK